MRDELAALLLTAGPQEYAQHIENRCVEAKDEGLCEATDGIRSQWFIQGGEAQFGAISGVTADELVSSILEAVRGTAGPQETRQDQCADMLEMKRKTITRLMDGYKQIAEMLGDDEPTTADHIPSLLSVLKFHYQRGQDALVRPQETPVCPTCRGRRWVAKSESHDHGNGIGSGGAWNEPCPQCGTPCETEGRDDQR